MTTDAWRKMTAMVALVVSTAIAGNARAVEKIEPDEKGVKLVGQVLTALVIEDEGERLKAVLALVHKSLKTKDGADLTRTVKEFSYKKAVRAAKLYENPPAIHQVHKGRDVTIGFKETAEKGRKDKYFVKKKEGVAGRPAPIIVFWPAGDGEPTVVDFGSL